MNGRDKHECTHQSIDIRFIPEINPNQQYNGQKNYHTCIYSVENYITMRTDMSNLDEQSKENKEKKAWLKRFNAVHFHG